MPVVSTIKEKCRRCYNCVRKCPAKAITLRHYMDRQVLAAIDGLLSDSAEEPVTGLPYPEPVGVAPPRWHKDRD